MSQVAQCACDVPINVQGAAGKPLCEDLFPGPAVSDNRNESILVHTTLQFRGAPSNSQAVDRSIVLGFGRLCISCTRTVGPKRRITLARSAPAAVIDRP